MPCQDCSKRHLCIELCPEAEAIVSQDRVPLRELPIGLPGYGSFPDLISKFNLTKKETEIASLLGRNLSRSDVCQLLNIKRKTLRNHLWKMRKKWDGFDYR